MALPVLGTRLGCLVASATWRLDQVLEPGAGPLGLAPPGARWAPALRLGFELRPQCQVAFNSLRLKPRLFLGNLGVEVGAWRRRGGGRGIQMRVEGAWWLMACDTTADSIPPALHL